MEEVVREGVCGTLEGKMMCDGKELNNHIVLNK